MILADENIDQRIIEELREAQFEVYSIRETNQGISDFDIIELSQNPKRLILTEDKDFGEWVFAHRKKNISVIFLRYHCKDYALIIKILIELIHTRKEELFGKFTTITPEKIRIRPLL